MYVYRGGKVVELTQEEEATRKEAMKAEQAPASPPTPEEQMFTFARSMAAEATTLSDETALSVPDLLATWEELLAGGEPIQPGVCLKHNGQVYRMVQPSAVTPQAHQPPGGEGMLAVYRPIDQEHAGTQADPIPWVYGMDCLEGKYYSYNDKVYRVAVGGTMKPCVWAPGTAGLWQWEEVN